MHNYSEVSPSVFPRATTHFYRDPVEPVSKGSGLLSSSPTLTAIQLELDASELDLRQGVCKIWYTNFFKAISLSSLTKLYI